MRRSFLFALCLTAGSATAAMAGSPAPAPAPAPDGATTDVYTFSSGRGHLGLVVIGLTDELKQFYGAGKDGVLVGKVEPKSPAAQAGVHVGDVLADVDGKPVDEAGDVLALLGGKKKDAPVALTLVRDHLPVVLTARLAADAPAFAPMPGDLGRMPGLSMDPLGSFGSFAVDDLQRRLDHIEQRLHDLDHK